MIDTPRSKDTGILGSTRPLKLVVCQIYFWRVFGNAGILWLTPRCAIDKLSTSLARVSETLTLQSIIFILTDY